MNGAMQTVQSFLEGYLIIFKSMNQNSTEHKAIPTFSPIYNSDSSFYIKEVICVDSLLVMDATDCIKEVLEYGID